MRRWIAACMAAALDDVWWDGGGSAEWCRVVQGKVGLEEEDRGGKK